MWLHMAELRTEEKLVVIDRRILSELAPSEEGMNSRVK
jgi:hypothetical protein